MWGTDVLTGNVQPFLLRMRISALVRIHGLGARTSGRSKGMYIGIVSFPDPTHKRERSGDIRAFSWLC